MVQGVGRLADRMLSLLVPETSAAACACNEWSCTNQICRNGAKLYRLRVLYGCKCTIVAATCGCQV
jgi:hypothetical protein